MLEHYYIRVDEEELENVPLQFVGVYTLRWHEHPEQPSVGFYAAENQSILDAAQDMLEALENVKETLEWALQEKGKMFEYAARDLTCHDSKLTLAIKKATG